MKYKDNGTVERLCLFFMDFFADSTQNKYMMDYFDRVFIDIDVHYSAEGDMRPLVIYWSDGTKYEIQRVKYVDKYQSKAVLPIRFVCLINGREKEVFYQPVENRWFVKVYK